MPDTIRGAAPGAAATSFGDAAWGEVFQDEQLRTLIRTALAQNDDVQIAAARVLQAEARPRHHARGRLPHRGRPAPGRRRTHRGDGLGRGPHRRRRSALGVSAGWEIDFWGRYRRATEGARAELLATEWGRRAVATAMVSDVADGYYSLRSLDLQLEIARRTLTSRQESLELTRIRERGGATSLVDVREAEQLVFGAGAAIADLERRIAQQENLLSVLLGGLPGGGHRAACELVAQPHPPTCRPVCPRRCSRVGPTSRRPSRHIVAANAQIGAARAPRTSHRSR